MVYGAINRKGEAYYTDLNRVLHAIGYRHKDYNWLITDCVCYPQNPAIAEMLSQDYCWLSGEQLSDLVMAENFQWIWADLCAFDRGIALAEVLQYELPRADGYDGFWQMPLTMQHPLAEIEIVPWDSSMTLLLSRRKDIVDNFRNYYPESENLGDYIRKP